MNRPCSRLGMTTIEAEIAQPRKSQGASRRPDDARHICEWSAQDLRTAWRSYRRDNLAADRLHRIDASAPEA